MDSPLLPQMKRHPDMTSSPTPFISNLTLSDPADDSFALATSHPSSHTSSSADQSDEWDPPEKVPVPGAGKSKPRFSLFAPSASGSSSQLLRQSVTEPVSTLEEGEGKEDEDTGEQERQRHQESDEDQTIHPRAADAGRDDRLRESLYELRQMNEVFDGFLTALEASRGHNERLAERVKQTSALLDQYTALLGQTEHTQNLILNPKWTGAQDDAAALAEDEAKRIAAEQAAQEAETRRLEEARQAEGARERQAAEAARLKDAVGRGGARGRGTRGLGRGTGIPPPTRGRVPSSTTSGIRKPSGGLGGQYANVKSSGYGPRRAE